MNKIKELATQAKLLDEDGWNTTNLTLLTEKFAELIIQECIDVIEDYDIPMHNGTPQEEVVHALWTIRGNIKEKFGVQ